MENRKWKITERYIYNNDINDNHENNNNIIYVLSSEVRESIGELHLNTLP